MELFEYIEMYARENPESTVLSDGKRNITYKQLFAGLKNNQTLLNMNGYVSKMNVILKLQNQFDFIVAFLSLLSIECWVIPVPDDITHPELQRIIDCTGARIFSLKEFEIFNADIDKQRDFIKPLENKAGIYHMTSGSTGVPKLCIRTLESLTAEGISYNKVFEIRTDDGILSAAPLYHSYAMGAALMAALVSGGCLYTIDRFVPRKALGLIQQYKIAVVIMVPMIARAMCNTFSTVQHDLSTIKVALVGAGPITEELYERFKQRYGIALLSNYGSTETGGIVSRLEPLPFTSIGKPMYGVDIKICSDYGERMADGQEGELWVKCNSMLKGYLGENDTIFDGEGFFPMGDIAVQDKDNYLYIKGRKKLLINIGGKKVNPYEVEEVLREYPGVKECAVAGMNKSNMEECIKAVIVGQGIEEAALRNYCAQRLSKHKIPSLIIFREAIPKNELGKINRKELAMLK